MAGKIATITEFSNDVSDVGTMLSRSGTDWDVARLSADGTAGYTSDKVALVRPDVSEALAFVSKRYAVNSHREHLHELQPLLDAGALIPDRVAVWNNGAMMAFQFRAPDLDFYVGNRDTIHPLLTLIHSYGTPVSESAFFCDFRTFCKNQMARINAAADVRLRHRGDIKGRFAHLLAAKIGAMKSELAEHKGTLERMLSTPMSHEDTFTYIGNVFGHTTEVIDQARTIPRGDLRGEAKRVWDVIDCIKADPTLEQGTVWAAYNGVTRYETHTNGRQAATRMRNALLGPGQKASQRAYALAAGMV